MSSIKCPFCNYEIGFDIIFPDESIFVVKENTQNEEETPSFFATSTSHEKALMDWYREFRHTICGTKKMMVKRKNECMWVLLSINEKGEIT
jgi:hypothetical protein